MTSMPMPHRSKTAIITAWAVHLLTASTAVIALLTLQAISQQAYIEAFILMGLAILIDAIDGTLARKFHVKALAARVDGALLDNMVDYINYVVTPAYLLIQHPALLSGYWRWPVVICLLITSAYQFTQSDAKTPDNFFKGFPCYWNFAVFYLFFFETPVMFNAFILLTLCALIFVPIKYVYPSRMDYLCKSLVLRRLMLAASALYGVATVMMLLSYPQSHTSAMLYSVFYILLYFGLSIYRTLFPLTVGDIA